MAPFLFVTDLDHTLVGDDAAMATLNAQLHHHRDTYGTKIVYNTGRSLTLYRELQSEKALLTPDALVTGVGTTIYYDDGDRPDHAWAQVLQQGWDRAQVVAIASQFEVLLPQPDSEQSSYKVSYYLSKAESHTVLPDLAARLQAAGLQVNLIYSGSLDLDILPKGANKGAATQFLRQQWQFATTQAVACGDSGNDLAMFATGQNRGIIVGNAQSELLEWHHANPSSDRYLASGACAAGILEGLAHFGFF